MNELREAIASHRVPRAEDYEPIVRGMRPFISEEEVKLRSTLMLMRDRAIATKGASTTCTPSWALLDVVEQVTTENATNHQVPLEMLKELRRLCVECVKIAVGFDVAFMPRTFLNDGEGHGRGE